MGFLWNAPKREHAASCVLYRKTAGIRTNLVAENKSGVCDDEGSIPTIAHPFYEYGQATSMATFSGCGPTTSPKALGPQPISWLVRLTHNSHCAGLSDHVIVRYLKKKLPNSSPSTTEESWKTMPQASRQEQARAHSRILDLEGCRWLFDSLPERALIINDQCEIVDANIALLEELNETPDTIVGRLCFELSPFCDRPCNTPNQPCPARKVFESGLPFSEVRAYCDSDGIKHHVEVTVSPLVDTAKQVLAVLETRRDITAQHHLENTLTAVYRLGQELVLTRDEVQIAEAVVNATQQTLNFQICALLLVENSDLYVAARAGNGASAAEIRLPINGDRGITVAVARSGKPIYVPDVKQDSRFLATPGHEIWSELAVPLQVGDRVIGVLNVESDRIDAFDTIDQQMLVTLADIAAVALESARAYRAEQQRASEQAALHKLGLALVIEHDPAAIVSRIFLELGDLLGIETAVVSILNQSVEELVLYGVDRGSPIPSQRLPLHGLSLSSHVIRTGQPLLISDISKDDLPVPGIQYGDRTASWLGVPLRVEDRIIGLINIQSYTPNVFGPAEVRLLTQIAAQVAPVLENAQLYQALRDHVSHLEDQVRSRTGELQAERDRTRAILESAAEGVIVTDLIGTIEYMNSAAEELTGFSRDQAAGQNARLWQSGHTPHEVYQEMWQTIQTGGIWEGELLNRRRDGSCYDALLTIAPIPGTSGEPIGFVGLQQDISERKELDRLKDLFVSNVSHELRAPLTNLKLYLKLMEQGRPEKRAQYMATLDREANRLHQLIEDLLSLSQLDVGNAQPIRGQADVNRLVSQLVDDRAALAAERGLALTTELAPNLTPVVGDEKMLAQVLTNLTTNAMNYTSAGGRIVVRTGQQKTDGVRPTDWITMSVIDTGYGVLPEEEQYLFDRFYRGEAARRASAPGTGLGLAICREIIKRHEGHITVDSELGKGSTFTVWLPAANRSDR